jgi:hypothetical protein
LPMSMIPGPSGREWCPPACDHRAEEGGHDVVDGVAVVLVEHVVQVPGEDPEGRVGQGLRDGVRVGYGHDWVGSSVDEEHWQGRAGLGRVRRRLPAIRP